MVRDDAVGSMISYTLGTNANSVFVGIWNHFAFHVRTLVASEPQSAGRHSAVWDGTDKDGNPLPGGTSHLPNFGERDCRRKPNHQLTG